MAFESRREVARVIAQLDPLAPGVAARELLRRLSGNIPGLIVSLAAVGLGCFAFKLLLAHAGHVQVFDALFLLLAFVHFYVDGLFWAFRDPHVRRSIGPYLMESTPATPAGR